MWVRSMEKLKGPSQNNHMLPTHLQLYGVRWLFLANGLWREVIWITLQWWPWKLYVGIEELQPGSSLVGWATTRSTATLETTWPIVDTWLQCVEQWKLGVFFRHSWSWLIHIPAAGTIISMANCHQIVLHKSPVDKTYHAYMSFSFSLLNMNGQQRAPNI